MSDPKSELGAAGTFIADFEHKLYLEWWTSLRLSDCGELVYRHAISCKCERTVSEAYVAWRKQDPEAAAAHDELVHSRIRGGRT